MFKSLDDLLSQEVTEELLIIGKAINTDDEELFEMCIDSLRSYDKEDIRRFLDEHKDVKSKLNDISNDSSGIIKSIVDGLLNKLSE
ncbi:hypothetical protein [Pseudobutyrivibrio xylanivorans]|uniref:Uncharacterized protein n=1 Tax=Pseudobutyrivibrio xylanivorans TaxID=185007 RepID=A0A5P6VPQ2_PSEXY|nr:hypothetical protein [Pseudobutyrivibrio xylanivorans]QFJ54665.1 hypothetical protein FXF36_07250 [Pseudobutyrivibrio xylanivorans]